MARVTALLALVAALALTAPALADATPPDGIQTPPRTQASIFIPLGGEKSVVVYPNAGAGGDKSGAFTPPTNPTPPDPGAGGDKSGVFTPPVLAPVAGTPPDGNKNGQAGIVIVSEGAPTTTPPTDVGAIGRKLLAGGRAGEAVLDVGAIGRRRLSM